jgi:hypothetical protein
VPELQGEPEDISKEKARLAAKEVVSICNPWFALYLHQDLRSEKNDV